MFWFPQIFSWNRIQCWKIRHFTWFSYPVCFALISKNPECHLGCGRLLIFKKSPHSKTFCSCAWNCQNPESCFDIWKLLSSIIRNRRDLLVGALWFRKIVRRSAHFACMELEVNHWQEEVHCQKSRWRSEHEDDNGSHQNEAQVITKDENQDAFAKFSFKVHSLPRDR